MPLYRADGAFRAVYLPKAGQWTVRFVYSPRSLLLGIYASFLAVITLLLLLGWWAWGRFYRGERSEVGTVAKNSAVQMGMSLLNRVIDFAFAMLRLRVLSPAGEGSYVVRHQLLRASSRSSPASAWARCSRATWPSRRARARIS